MNFTYGRKLDPSKLRDGTKCRKCGENQRYKIGGGCVRCIRATATSRALARAAEPDASARREIAKGRIPIFNHPARLAAIASGKLTWPGVPCKYGHDLGRFIWASSKCIQCHANHTGKTAKHYLQEAPNA